ncbi:YoaK family protein (plasmid) [Rhizobium sp. CC1099]|uniref:YoaK family protein n=1 Tax=Rhizobium sp. CC1099 TaxID=3039160 RepID=UPI0024B23203|nr:YoaK family protein [Rhizobium sp. CC1099]WFU89863.1 YoaK family protein [Rhizobium sp. CC1099]
MLIRQGHERNEQIDRKLASCLAAIAGALNAAAFYAVGFFSANMTGNISTFSDHIAVGAWISALFYLAIIVTFILGATVSTLLINAGRRRNIHAIYAYSILTEGILLAILGCADLWLLGEWRAPVLVIGLAFLMGLQNAVVTRISNARVRTTHISGMATDVGIELGMAFDILRGRERPSEAQYDRAKLLLHVQTILAFLFGGILGVLVYRSAGGLLLIATAALLLAIAMAGIFRVQQQRAQAP